MALEIMSPAGSYESVVAAVRGGADAVYFGAGDFNARRNAKNLTDEELSTAIKYCRLRGVKTYLTVNTLVTDRELERGKELVEKLNNLGADALIVQDLGMGRLMRAVAPEMPLFASTQLTVHNLAGVLAAQELGFSRVVLSRELPLSEIEFICRAAPIEVEIFGHGALCMCYSGQCYFSAVVGGRSGNRGLCAQPCRMQYSYFGDAPTYPLSLKDLSLADQLKQIEAAGVTSLKIEGRMKRPEYTALVTKIYKDALLSGNNPSKADLFKLEKLFSRDGFTQGYFNDKKGHDMFGVRGEGESAETRAIYKEAQQIYQPEPEPPTIAVDFVFEARKGQRMSLNATDADGNSYYAEAPAAEEALSRPTEREDISSALHKTGGTVFFARKLDIKLDSGLRISASTLNAMRRQCTEGLAAVRRMTPKRPVGQWQPGLRRLPHEGKPGYIYSFLKLSQLTPAILDMKPDWVYLPLKEIADNAEVIRAITGKGQKVAAVLDRVIFDREWPQTLERLKVCKKSGVTALVCTNIGQPKLLRELGFELRGDFGLNIMNSQAIKEIKAIGLSSFTVSFEMTLPQIKDLSLSLPGELMAYGRLPLMITENCVIKKKGSTACVCDGAPVSITDKTGRAFPILREEGCRNTVYNAEKLYLADKLEEINGLGMRWLRLSFTTEHPKECLQIANAYNAGEKNLPPKITRGLYYRGVQ